MASPNLDELVVKIGADFHELKSELDKANKRIEDFGKESKDSGKKIEKLGDSAEKAGKKTDKASKSMLKSIKKLRATLGALKFAAIGAGGAIAAITAKTIHSSKETELWARRLGTSTSAMSQMAAIGKRFGAELDEVGDAMKDLNERIGDAASGNKMYEEGLRSIGLSSRELIGIPVEEQFIKVANAVGKLTTAEKQNFASAELMSEAGFRMIPVFQQGEKAIRNMRSEVVATGEAMSSLEAQKLEKANKAILDMTTSFSAFSKNITVTVLPLITGLTDAIVELQEKAAGEFFAKSESGLKKQHKLLNDQVKTAEELVEKLKGDGAAPVRLHRAETALNLLYQRRVKLVDKINDAEEARGSKTLTLSNGLLTKNKEQLKLDKQIAKAKAAAVEQQIKDMTELAGRIADKDAAELTAVWEKDAALEEAAKKEADRKEKTQNDATMAAFMKELEAQNEHIANSMAIDLENKHNQIQREIDHQATMSDIKKEAMDRELSEEEKQAKAIKDLWESGAEGKLKVSKKLFGQMASLMNSENKKAFEVGKAAAIANATISTYEAANTNYKMGAAIGGPPVGAAFAAVAVAAGLSNVQKIASTSFGSRGGSGGSAGGAVAGGAEGGEAQQQTQTTNFDISLQGESFSGEQVRSLIGQINEGTEDGVTLNAIVAR